VFIYGGLLLALLAAFAWGVGARTMLIAEALRDRNALYRETASGIENGYTLKLVNKSDQPAHYVVKMESSTPAWPCAVRTRSTCRPATWPQCRSPWPGPKAFAAGTR
jgi:polyferredoxin